jgi:hypothetical protein
MIVLCDSREPANHPWAQYVPPGWSLERTALETGDFCLGTHPHGALVERKTPRDMAGCIGAGRERFDRELRISSYAGRFEVLVEGSLSDVALARHGIHTQQRRWHARVVDAALLPDCLRRKRTACGGIQLEVPGQPASYRATARGQL